MVVALLLGIATFQLLAAQGTFARKDRQEVCPVNAIYMENGKAKIDEHKCIGCGRCADGFLAIPASPELPVDAVISTDELLPEQTMESGEGDSPKAETENPKNPQALAPKPADSNAKATLETESDAFKDHYVVDANACISCRLCVRVCPVGAISMVKGKAVIDPEKCINCGICAGEVPEKFRGCPVDAIHPALPDSLKS